MFDQQTADSLDLVNGAQKFMKLIIELCETWARIRPAMVAVLPAAVVASVDNVAAIVCPFAELYKKVYPQ